MREMAFPFFKYLKKKVRFFFRQVHQNTINFYYISVFCVDGRRS